MRRFWPPSLWAEIRELRESLEGVLTFLPYVNGPKCSRARAALEKTK
jgi:hypothetical protein